MNILSLPVRSPDVGVAFFAAAILYFIIATAFYQVDFRAYYVAAKATQAGLDPYVNNVALSEEFDDTHHLQATSRLKYPPTCLPFLAPLAMFDYPTAKMIFTATLHLALVLLLILLSAKRQISAGYLILILVSLPVLVGVERGQIDILMVTLVVLSHALRRHWTGGLFLAMSISIKLLGVFLLPYYIFRGERKIVVWTIVFLLAMAGYSTAIYGVTSWHGFLNNLFPAPGKAPAMLHVTFTHSKVALYWLFGDSGHWLLDGPGIAHLSIAENLFARFKIGLYAFAILLIGLHLVATRRVRDEQLVFATYLVVLLSANNTLWLMGLVWYIPAAFEMLASRGARLGSSFLILLPFFFPPFITSGKYSLAYACALLVVLFHLRTVCHAEDNRVPTGEMASIGDTAG